MLTRVEADMIPLSTHLWRHTVCAVLVVPVHGTDPVQLLDAEDGAEVVGNLVQGLLWLLVDHEEAYGLPDVLELVPGGARVLQRRRSIRRKLQVTVIKHVIS